MTALFEDAGETGKLNKHLILNDVVVRKTVQQVMKEENLTEVEVVKLYKLYEGECPCH